MRSAGYDDVERGERGSSEEHLTVTQFKTEREQERLAQLQEVSALAQVEADKKNKEAASAEKKAAQARAKLDDVAPLLKGMEKLAADFSDDPEAETAFTLVMGIIPLVTSAVNLALGYVISDPIKRRLDTLRYQSALLKEQVNRLYAAECELNRNWENALPETETERLKAAKGTIQADSDRIKKWARLALAKKLGDAESISELTDT